MSKGTLLTSKFFCSLLEVSYLGSLIPLSFLCCPLALIFPLTTKFSLTELQVFFGVRRILKTCLTLLYSTKKLALEFAYGPMSAEPSMPV